MKQRISLEIQEKVNGDNELVRRAWIADAMCLGVKAEPDVIYKVGGDWKPTYCKAIASLFDNIDLIDDDIDS